MTYRKNPAPVPTPTPITEPFWRATAERRLLLQECDNSHLFYYARSHCPRCLSSRLEWREASGKGRIYSYTVVRRPQSPEFVDDVPYVVAAITLEEGPRMTSLVVDVDPDKVKIDAEVEVTWQPINDAMSMPYFSPVKE